MNIKRLAIDLAKDVFLLYGVDEERKQVVEKRIKSREKFVEFVTTKPKLVFKNIN